MIVVKWLLVLAAVAAVTWWVSRPSAGAKRSPRQNIKMSKCPHCGVYVEQGGSCRCQEEEQR